MDADDLALAIERHATSKLADDDLSSILTLGFRGEALPSIGAVARLSIQSRAQGAGEAYEIAVDGGRKAKLKPAALALGTRVEVRDLFYATPARLKFMKSERAESAAIADMVKRLALARSEIAFSLTSEDRVAFRLEACSPGLIDHGLARLGRILGPDLSRMRCLCVLIAATCRSKASPAFPRCTGRTASSSTSPSMAVPCAISYSPARCARLTAISCRKAAIPCSRCF
jgi:DNA mismatch repair protein MutL